MRECRTLVGLQQYIVGYIDQDELKIQFREPHFVIVTLHMSGKS